MRYFNHNMQEKLRGQFSFLENTLQKTFPENDKWGVNILFSPDGERIDHVEICSLSEVTPNKAKWTHYALITQRNKEKWEVSRRFMGDNESEIWVYNTYDTFPSAITFVASGKINNALPLAKL